MIGNGLISCAWPFSTGWFNSEDGTSTRGCLLDADPGSDDQRRGQQNQCHEQREQEQIIAPHEDFEPVGSAGQRKPVADLAQAGVFALSG